MSALSLPPVAGPIVDRAHLDRMTGGDASLALEVLDLFGEQMSMWLRLLEPDAELSDWLSAVHTIKGSARGIGAWELAEACHGAEEAASVEQFTRDMKREWGEILRDHLDAVSLAIATIRHDLAIRSLRG